MMVKPSVSELLEKLVVVTSKRARQLAEGAEPLTNKKEHSKVTLAAQEIAEGKVRMVNDEEIAQEVENEEEVKNEEE